MLPSPVRMRTYVSISMHGWSRLTIFYLQHSWWHYLHFSDHVGNFTTPAPLLNDNRTEQPQIVCNFTRIDSKNHAENNVWPTDDYFLQEVTLQKCNSEERLGLTVCYSSGSSSEEADNCTEVYIRDIIPKSVADRDGRLKQGDQILQVSIYYRLPSLTTLIHLFEYPISTSRSQWLWSSISNSKK